MAKWDPKKAPRDGELEYIDLGAIDQDRKVIAGSRPVTPDTAPTRARQLVQSGDVLVATVRPALNGVARVPEELHGALASTGFSVLRADPERLDGGYLFHWVRTPEFVAQLVQRATGANYPAVSDTVIRSLDIPLPALAQQRDIRGRLDKVMAVVENRRVADARLRDLQYSIFADLFGGPVAVMKAWPIKPLGELLDFLTSGSRGWAKHYADDGSLFLRIQNVRRDELVLDDVAFVDAPDTAEARRTRVKPGDVLMSVTADLGRSAVVPSDIGEAYINQHLAILRTTVLVPRYLSAYLSSPSGQAQVMRLNRQGVKAGLNFDDIRSLRLPCPPHDVQQEFVDRCGIAERLQRTYSVSRAQHEALFASLQSEAFAR